MPDFSHADSGRAKWLWLGLGWLVPVVVLGVPYFSATYSQVERTGVVWGWGLVVLAACALVVRAFGGVTWWEAAAAPLAALLTLVGARIVLDVAADPTSHNLWPFELAIALVVGGAATCAGALLGTAIGRLLRP